MFMATRNICILVYQAGVRRRYSRLLSIQNKLSYESWVLKAALSLLARDRLIVECLPSVSESEEERLCDRKREH